MDPSDFGPRLIVGLVGTVIMLVMSGGFMWMQHRSIERMREENVEPVATHSVSVADQTVSAFHQALQHKQVAQAEQKLAALKKLDPKHRDLAAMITRLSREKAEEANRQTAAAVDAWRQKRDTSDAGLVPLVEAAAKDPMGTEPQLQRTLVEDVPPDRLKAAGLRLAKERPEAALAFLHAAQRRASGRDDLQPVQRAIEAVRLAVARAALNGRLPGFRAEQAGPLLQPLRHAQDARVRAEALALLLDAALANLRAARDDRQFSLAAGRLREAGDLVVELWLARLANDAEPWKQVPAAVREDIEDDNPGATPEALVQALEVAVRNRRWVPPEAEKLKAELPGLLAAWGLADLDRDREGGLERLRSALRSSDAAAKKVAVAGLQAACRAALAKQDFAAVVDLAGFVIAETSMDQADPFRAELRKGLEASSAHFGTQSPRTRVFVLTLLADLLAGDPAGAAARAEALAMGEQLMAGLTPKPAAPELLRLPSGLPGYAVMRVDNGTTFHLMMFYAGPEKFYVRLNPMRRGLLVVKDGSYTTAVMGNTEEVVPYRGTQVFASDLKEASYTIKREGRGAEKDYTMYTGSAYGAYTLLRVADGANRQAFSARFVEKPAEEPDEARTKAVAALRTGTGTTAGDAVRELARHKSSAEAFEALAWALESHPDPNLPYLVAETLPRFRRRFDVLKAFEKAIARAKPEQVGTLVSSAARGQVPGVERLVAAGLARPEPAVRSAMVRVLAAKDQGIPLAAAEQLLAPLVADPDPGFRKAVVRALGERGSPKGFAAAEALLQSTDPKQRSDGLFVLSGYFRQTPRTATLLVQAEGRETDRRLKGDLLRTICALGGDHYPTLLAQRLRTGTTADKLDALHYLYVWAGKVDPLRPALQAAAADPDPKVRQRAAQKLAELQAR